MTRASTPRTGAGSTGAATPSTDTADATGATDAGSARGAADGRTRAAVLDAALDIVAERGLQALTHRGVEARANVSHGVTTYYFRTREAMIRALLGHICDRQIAWVTRMYETLAAEQGRGVAQADREAFARQAVELMTAERTLTLARYELFLHSARVPEFQQLTAQLRARHVAVQAAMFAAAGASDPQFAAHRLLSAVEGMLLYQLSVPEPDFGRWAPAYLLRITELLIQPLTPEGRG